MYLIGHVKFAKQYRTIITHYVNDVQNMENEKTEEKNKWIEKVQNLIIPNPESNKTLMDKVLQEYVDTYRFWDWNLLRPEAAMSHDVEPDFNDWKWNGKLVP